MKKRNIRNISPYILIPGIVLIISIIIPILLSIFGQSLDDGFLTPILIVCSFCIIFLVTRWFIKSIGISAFMFSLSKDNINQVADNTWRYIIFIVIVAIIWSTLESKGITSDDIVGRGLGLLVMIWRIIKRPLIIGGGLYLLVRFIKRAWNND